MLKKLLKTEGVLNSYFIEREDEIRGLTLGILSGNNVLFLGPPGVSKSLLVNSWASLIKDTNYFGWLVNRFSTPEELFGPYSLKGLENDEYKRITDGKLPDSHVGFIDEVFKCNSGVLNALLSVLNERTFHNNGKAEMTPVLTVVGASNELPEESDNLEAMYDRFQLKYMVSRIQEPSNFSKLMKLKNGFDGEPILSLSDIHTAKAQAMEVQIPDEMVDLLTDLREKLKEEKIDVTDRTYMFSKKLLKAEAYLNGRSEVTEEDFEILQNSFWSEPEQKKTVYSTILNTVNPAKSKVLEIYYDATDLFDDLMASNKRDTESTEKSMEAVIKLKDAKKALRGHYLDAKKNGQDFKIVQKYEKKVDVYLNKVYAECLEVSF